MGIALVDKKTNRKIGGTPGGKKVGEKMDGKGRNAAPRDAKPFREKLKLNAQYKSAGGMIYTGRD